MQRAVVPLYFCAVTCRTSQTCANLLVITSRVRARGFLFDDYNSFFCARVTRGVVLFVALKTSLTLPPRFLFLFPFDRTISTLSNLSFNGVASGVLSTTERVPKFGFKGAANRASNRATSGLSAVNRGVRGVAAAERSAFDIGVANAKCPGVSCPPLLRVASRLSDAARSPSFSLDDVVAPLRLTLAVA